MIPTGLALTVVVGIGFSMAFGAGNLLSSLARPSLFHVSAANAVSIRAKGRALR